LKKNYGLDLDKNSGFYKTRQEKLVDIIKEHQVPTIVITAVVTILTAVGIIKIG
jgi:hypothetical protein